MAETVDGRTVAFTRFNRFTRDGWGFDSNGELLGDRDIPGIDVFVSAVTVWMVCQMNCGRYPNMDETADAFCIDRALMETVADRIEYCLLTQKLLDS